METLGWYRYEGTVDCEGIGREMERAAERMGGTTKWPYNDSDCLDADQFKMVADSLVTENGIRPLLHCMCVDVLKNSVGEITGVITESKSGRQAILAKRVIDCTGDADVAYLGGCEYTMLDTSSRMGCTTVFNVAGVDKDKFLSHVDTKPSTYAGAPAHPASRSARSLPVLFRAGCKCLFSLVQVLAVHAVPLSCGHGPSM
jgi:hypothetical protein